MDKKAQGPTKPQVSSGGCVSFRGEGRGWGKLGEDSAGPAGASGLYPEGRGPLGLWSHPEGVTLQAPSLAGHRCI